MGNYYMTNSIFRRCDNCAKASMHHTGVLECGYFPYYFVNEKDSCLNHKYKGERDRGETDNEDK